ncbi:conserved hypothetical protein [Pseudomonas sp. PM2]|uniref:Uncharacterized protein n=1 Tax=Pseudomonas fluorescens TaxID=294 RepID=A0A109L9P0_PSEFL|nr:hypothetical protein PFL603g_00351 [Pseudomonas fluorescens]
MQRSPGQVPGFLFVGTSLKKPNPMWELACLRLQSVGASLLAKNVNDNACLLNERGAFEFFASKLAPTKSLN